MKARWTKVPVNPVRDLEISQNEFLDAPFSLSEMLYALEKARKDSAPGLDQIDYGMIKHLSLRCILLLLDLYNEIFSSHLVPEDWTRSQIIMIKKSDGCSFRPISLTSCVCKLFERLINTRLQWWCEYHNIIPSSQAGFRIGRSCVDNVMNLTMYAEGGFIRSQYTVAAFLDVSAAFDNVQSGILLEKLAKLGVPIGVISFIANLTYCRTASFVTGLNEKLMYKGVPQGGVLSPILFNIYVSNIMDGISEGVRVSQYADDIVVYTRDTSIERARSQIEQAVSTISNNLFQIGLELTPEKTDIMVFNKRNLQPGKVAIQIGQHTRYNTDRVKFLGICFDPRLSFGPHIDVVRKQCLKTLNIIKYLRGVWWGCDPETLIAIYKSLIRSKIDYGCFAYLPNKDHLIDKIESIQNRALKLALGLRMSTPDNVVLSEAGIPNIKERTIFMGKSYLSKIISNSSHDTNRQLREFTQDIDSPAGIVKKCDKLRSGPDILAGRFGFVNSDRGEISHHHLTIVDLSVGVAWPSQGMVG